MTKDGEKQRDALRTWTAQSCRGKSWTKEFRAKSNFCSYMAGRLIHRHILRFWMVSHAGKVQLYFCQGRMFEWHSHGKALQGRTCLTSYGVMA